MAKAGAVWLDVLPSMKGWNAAVKTQAKISLTGVGSEAGTSYAKGMKASMLKGLKGTGAALKAELESGVKEAAEAVKAAEAKIATARKAQADMAGKLRVAEAKLQEVRDKDGATASQVAAAEERVAAARRNSELATQKATAADKELELANGKVAAATDAAAAASTKRFVPALKTANKGMMGLGSKAVDMVKSFGPMIGLFGAVEVGKLGAESIKSAQDFQQSTNVLVTAAGESEKNLGTIRSGLKKIAVDTGTDLDNLTKGEYLIEKAGYRGAAGLKILSVASQGAREEGAQLDTVTNAMTSVMASYHLGVGKAVNVMNAMKTAAGQSKVTMEQFAGSLSTVLPVASANKISFASVAGALATLTQHGTTADEATQELSNTIRNLSAPNNVASKEMAQFGISSNDVSKKLGKRGLTGTLDYLSQTVLKKMGPSGLVLLKSFNQSKAAAQDAETMYSALKKNADSAWSEVGKGLVNVGSAVDPVKMKFSKFLDGLRDGSVSTTQYRNAIKSLNPVLGKQVSQFQTTLTNAKGFNNQLRQGIPGSETYTAAIKKMTGGANGLNTTLQLTGESLTGTKTRTAEVAKSFKDGGKSVEGWQSTQNLLSVQTGRLKEVFATTGITLATKLLPSLTKGAKFLADFGVKAVAFASANKSWLGPLAKGLGIIIGLWTALNIVLSLSPFMLIVIGVTALVAGLILAYKHIGWFHAAVDGVGKALKVTASAIKTAFLAVINWFTGSFIPFFSKTIPGVFDSVKGWISARWKGITSIFSSVIDWLKKNWMDIAGILLLPFGGAVLLITHHWDLIKNVFLSAYQWVKKTFAPLWKLLDVLIVTPIRLAIRLVQIAWDKIRGPFSDAVKWVGHTFKSEWGQLLDSLKAPLIVAGKWISIFWKNEKTGWINIAHWVTSTFSNAWKKISGVLSGPVSSAKSAISDRIDKIRSTFTSAKNWVTGTWAKSWAGVKDMMSGPVSSARSTIGTILGKGKNGLQSAFSDAVTNIGKIWDGLKSIAKEPIKFIVNTVLNDGLIAGYNKIAQFAWGNSKHNLSKITLPNGFDTGGWTGPGSKLKPAGIVHADEFVVQKKSRRKFERKHPGMLDQINRTGSLPVSPAGYDGGGLVTFDGGRFTEKFAQTVMRLSQMVPGFQLYQGGWNAGGVAASAGTHDRDALDYGPANRTNETAGRKLGLAAWLRDAATGWTETMAHIHAVPSPALGDGSPSARAQYQSYLNGFNGLANNGRDTGSRAYVGKGGIGGFFGGLLTKGSDLYNRAKGIFGGAVNKVEGILSDPLKFLTGSVKAAAAGLSKIAQSDFVQTIGRVPTRLLADVGGALKSKIGGFLGNITGGSAGTSPVGAAQTYAKSIMSKFGWGADQWGPLQKLWQNESGWNDKAVNSTSGAGGIPQALPASKMGAGWFGNYVKQINWGEPYIKTNYGTPANALAKWEGRNPHWYDTGGTFPPGTQLMHNGTGANEFVLTGRQMEAVAGNRDLALLEKLANKEAIQDGDQFVFVIEGKPMTAIAKKVYRDELHSAAVSI